MDWKEFYEPIPDVDAYLARIRMGREQPSREYLDALMYAHQCAIPFETLDVTDYHRPVSLRTKDLFHKIVVRKRGGYCFELNGLFVLLLQALGFDAYSCAGRMLMHDEPVPIPATHRASIVRLDRQILFCDVGFGGPMASGSLIFTDGPRQTVRGETFWFQQESAHWHTLMRMSTARPGADIAGMYRPKSRDKGKRTLPLISVCPAEWLPVDFYAPNLVRSQGDAVFPVRTVALRMPNGYISLIENTFTEFFDNACVQKSAVSEEEAAEILRTRFGLTPEQ